MAGQNYLLLLNNTFKDHILTLDAHEKRRLREKLEYLESGLWDAGIRVKKLKGISNKVVFEARLSKAERMLFTLGRHREKTAIYLWGIVKHDDVGAKAKAILPANTPFLQFEPRAEEELPEVFIDDLTPDYYSQENVEEKSPEEYGPQKWLVLSDEEWRRLLLAGGAESLEIQLFLTSEQAHVLAKDPPILLSGTAGSGKTTIAVYYLFRGEFAEAKRLFLTYSPFLRRFSKRIYDGLVRYTDMENDAHPPDFFTLRDLMTEILKASGASFDETREVGLKDFEAIYANHGLAKKYDAELVWEEIRAIIKGAKPPLNANRCKKLVSGWRSAELSRDALNELIDYFLGLKRFGFIEKIGRIIEKKTSYSSYDEFVSDLALGVSAARSDALFVLEEVVKTVEHKASSFSTPLLSFDEYQVLGKKRAPNFLYDRKDIYSIAEYYQGRLEGEGLWDGIDLARRALRLLQASPGVFQYDLVICDEVQDLSDIHLALLFRIVRSCRNLLLAGDVKQIINPSGFRWEEVKEKFFERGERVPEVTSLNLNFRCVGSIVQLANALLDLKQRLVGLSHAEQRERWKFSGKPPFLVRGVPEDELLRTIAITGAGQVILVRTATEGERLKRLLGTELVFTIHEAKGLEFDAVCLWHFSQDPKAAVVWRKIKDEHGFDQGQYPHIKHEINLLYVGVTRARNTLVVYDGETPSDVWEIDALRESLTETDRKEDLIRVWQRVSSPAEWEEQGDYLFEREYYPAAVECYRNAGNTEKAETAEAFTLEKRGVFEKAAALFAAHGYAERAAHNYEKAGRFETAAGLWERLGDEGRAHLCRIRVHEQAGEFDRAALEWEKRGDIDNALRNWEKAANHRRIAEHFVSLRRYEDAARRFELAGLHEEACDLYIRLGMREKAALLYFNAADYRNAATLYRKLKKTDAVVRCLEKMEDHLALALIHEKEKDLERAIDAFAEYAKREEGNAAALKEEAELFEKGGKSLRAALRYSAVGMYDRSAPVYMKKGHMELAMQEFEKSGNSVALATCYRAVGDYYKEALELEKTSLPGVDRNVEEALERYMYPKGKYDKKRADRLFLEAEELSKRGAHARALGRYRAIRFPEKIRETYLKLDRDDEAVRYFIDNDLPDDAEAYIDRKDGLAVSPDLIRDVISGDPGGRRWRFRSWPRFFGLAAKLIESCLKTHRDEGTTELMKKALDTVSTHRYFEAKDPFPSRFLSLVLELKSYNTLFTVLEWRYYKKKGTRLPKEVETFLAAVKERADTNGDRRLSACYWYFYDKEEFEKTLETLEAGPYDFELFAESARSYEKAVHYLESRGEIHRAAGVSRMNGDFALAGAVHERAGDFKTAGRHYKDGKMFNEALECFKKAGAEREIARVYEKMGEYGKALELWGTLGNKKEAQRIKKKVRKTPESKDQLELL